MKRLNCKKFRTVDKLLTIGALLLCAFLCLGMPEAYSESEVLAVIEDFNDMDPASNFLGLDTGAGNYGTGDLHADFDTFGANPGNPLNTSHQVSWDGALGDTPGTDDAFWYSYINDGALPVLPVADFSHLSF